MTDGDKAQFKPKHIFSETLPQQQIEAEQELTAQIQFQSQQDFVAVEVQASENSEAESKLEQVIRPKSGSKWLVTTVLTSFAGLTAWQAIDSIVNAIHTSDWLSLGWSGFIGGLSLLGVGALAKELFKLRKLRRHFSVQQQSEALLCSDAVGQGREFCQSIAKQSGVKPESAGYDRWVNSINASHSDAEILDMYDAMVVAEQDKSAVVVVTQHATESAALVAISPLAIADMLLVAWRNFKMIDSLAAIYGVELSYWSRIELLKATLINIAAAGATELAVDVGRDLMSMDLTAKISARAGQGLGVGILTARLGLKAMALLRPIPWHKERRMRLGAIRKQIAKKIVALSSQNQSNE